MKWKPLNIRLSPSPIAASNRLNIELAMPGCARRRAVLGRPGRPLPRVAELLRRQGGAGAGEEGLDAQGHDSIGYKTV